MQTQEPELENICKETLLAAVRNYQRYLDAGKASLPMKHKFLTQTAIMQQLWSQIEDQRGYRSKYLLSRTFRELERRNWLQSEKGKHKALLYFPTELGMEICNDYVAQDCQITLGHSLPRRNFTDRHQNNASSVDVTGAVQVLASHFDRQHQVEQILSKLSNRFVSFSSFPDAVNASLSDIGKTLSADRTFLVLFHEQRNWHPNKYEWCSFGIPSAIEKLSNYHINTLLLLLKKLGSQDYILVQDKEPRQLFETIEQALLSDQNARSLLIFPFIIDNRFRGFLGIVDLHKIRAINKEDIAFLRVCRGLVSSALVRTEMSHVLSQRTRELNCLYKIGELLEKSSLTLKELFEKLAILLPTGWDYPEITGGRIIVKGEEFCSLKFKENAWLRSADIMVNGEKIGSVAVSYSEECPAERTIEDSSRRSEERFLKALAKRLGQFVERRNAIAALHEQEEAIKIAPKGHEPVFI
ncbi:MAG: GAF domain-containing protein [Candidatus Thorarchaeota archaeon]